jgi:serine protease AprX
VTVKIDSQLTRFFATHAPGATVPVIITYKQKPGASEFSKLKLAGITKGFAMRELPMVIADMSALQLASVSSSPNVVSIYSNRLMKTFTNVSRPFIGVPQMQADTQVTKANTSNPGFPVTGKGVGIGYIDTGLDATHKDLAYGKKTVQNVIQPLSETVVSDAGLVGAPASPSATSSTTRASSRPSTSRTSRCPTSSPATARSARPSPPGRASSRAASTAASRAARTSSASTPATSLGLPSVAIIGAYDYLLANQYALQHPRHQQLLGLFAQRRRYRPEQPHQRRDAHLPRPQHHGRLRGGQLGRHADFDQPLLDDAVGDIGRGGREAGSGLARRLQLARRRQRHGRGRGRACPPTRRSLRTFGPTSRRAGVDIKSARLRGAGLTNTLGTVPVVGNDLTTIPPAYLPYYTTSQGTSFSCPHISGVVALMIEANPLLTPDDVVTILRQTANPMPFDERVVGAGYVDAHNAVRAAMGLTAVPHPFNLFPDPNGPTISDPAGDQSGTDAQDIRTADFRYDAANQPDRLHARPDERLRRRRRTTRGRSARLQRRDGLRLGQRHGDGRGPTSTAIRDLPNGTNNQVGDGAPDSGRSSATDRDPRRGRQASTRHRGDERRRHDLDAHAGERADTHRHVGHGRAALKLRHGVGLRLRRAVTRLAARRRRGGQAAPSRKAARCGARFG